MLTTGTYGEDTRLVPMEKMKGYQFPQPSLTRSPGHYRDWIRACKGGDPACSNFEVAVPFVESMLLGTIALRFPGKLEWDAERDNSPTIATRTGILRRPSARAGHLLRAGFATDRRGSINNPLQTAPWAGAPACIPISNAFLHLLVVLFRFRRQNVGRGTALDQILGIRNE